MTKESTAKMPVLTIKPKTLPKCTTQTEVSMHRTKKGKESHHVTDLLILGKCVLKTESREGGVEVEDSRSGLGGGIVI